MLFLSDTWMVWLVLAGTVGGIVVFFRESRRSDTGAGFPASQDEFSIKTILFGVRRGEGDLFIGYLGTMIFFSMFLAGFTRWIQIMF